MTGEKGVSRRSFLKKISVGAGVAVAAGIVGGVIGSLSREATTITREIFKTTTSFKLGTKTMTSVSTLTETVVKEITKSITAQNTITSTVTKTLTTIPERIRSRFPFSGVNLVWWPADYEPSATARVIDHLASLSVNYIMLLLELDQESGKSSSLTAAYDLKKMLDITKYAKIKGMRVAWLPFIIVRDGTWRGEIRPDDPAGWFRSYEEHLNSIAVKANESDVDLLMLGSELETMTDLRYEEEWRSILRAVRRRYWGPLCYAVNWWYDEAGYKKVLASKWLKELDYIGISAYFELTSKNDPTVEELTHAWKTVGVKPGSSIVSELENLYESFGRPIIFTEIGYRSVNGANKQPWNCGAIPDSDNRYDPQEQADCYEAFFRVFSEKHWWRGCFIWAYDTSLTPQEKDYKPLNQPAEKILHKWYKPE